MASFSDGLDPGPGAYPSVVPRQSSTSRALRCVVLATIAGFGHVIYPLYLLRKTADSESPSPPRPSEWPSVSVVIPAYLEAGVVRDKVADTFSNGYSGPLEVVVVADDPDTAAAARETQARVVNGSTRGGKARSLNRGVEAAEHDVIVLTDANTKLSPGALEHLVRWLTDESIDAVAGEKRVEGGGGESLYWRFESWLKQREFMLGTTIGLVGELAAIRRAHYRPLPEDVTNDDLWLAIEVVSNGGRIAYEPLAVALEAEQGLDDEWQRRTRVVAGGLDVLWRQRSALAPGASAATPQLWGHRLVRMTAGPIAHLALLRSSVRSAHRSRLARMFLAAHIGGASALVRARRDKSLTPPERAAAHALWLQAVALGGLWRFLRREDTVLWPKRER